MLSLEIEINGVVLSFDRGRGTNTLTSFALLFHSLLIRMWLMYSIDEINKIIQLHMFRVCCELCDPWLGPSVCVCVCVYVCVKDNVPLGHML